MVMNQETEEPGEAEINALINATPVINALQADMDHANTLRLAQDVAFGIYPPDEIAERWGFGNHAGLKAYLIRHPKLVEFIAGLRAIHKSDAGVEERNKLKANHALEQAIPSIANMVMDPKLKPAERLEAAKVLQKQSGADKVDTKGGAVANAFSVTINLPGRPPVTTTVVPTIEGDVA